jgi:hypothetical protein
VTTSSGHVDSAQEARYLPAVALLRAELSDACHRAAIKLIGAGYIGARPLEIITSSKYHHRWLRSSYHSVTKETVLTWDLAGGYALTPTGAIAHLSLAHEDPEGRDMATRPRPLSERRYWIGGWMVVPVEQIKERELATLIEAARGLISAK